MKFLKQHVQLDKHKGVIGLVLGLFALVICFAYQKFLLGLGFGALFAAVGYFKIKPRALWLCFLYYGLWIFSALLLLCHAPAVLDGSYYPVNVPFSYTLLNLLAILWVFGLVFTLTVRPRTSVITGFFLLMLLITVNAFVYRFRGKEMSVMDLLSIKTAFHVAGQYEFQLTPPMTYEWISWVLIAFVGFSLPPLPRFPRRRARFGALASGALIAVLFCYCAANIPIKTWEDEGTRLNGYYLNFYLSLRDALVSKPAGYHPQAVEELAENYSKNTPTLKKNAPDIVVIMDESFADFRVFGPLKTNQSVTPFLDSLTQNTQRGFALTSAFGGNTCNAEFEFLTGLSLAFLPQDSVPYQQYIRSETDSLPRWLASLGYKTYATHPFYESGWSRNTLYPLLGFQDSTFIDDYPSTTPIRNYISDRDTFQYILNLLDNHQEDAPLFLFGITMQNHGGYQYKGENFEPVISLTDYSQNYPRAEQYLSLIHETDKAVEFFIKALQEREEDTIVLFFGDHWPQLEGDFYKELSDEDTSSLPQKMAMYTVPYFIWANYPIPKTEASFSSLNFLSTQLLKTAGLPLSPYHQFLSDVQKTIPAMCALGFYSPTHGDFRSYETASEEEAHWLKQYHYLLYNQIFDEKHKSQTLFQTGNASLKGQ